jgi:hypothetical protein
MKTNRKETVILRSYALFLSIGVLIFAFFTSQKSPQAHFETIDVERINIIEKDGTVKLLITNQERFPNSADTINGRINHDRGQYAGMLFYNDEGIECGGFIYNGAKNEEGHSSGLSLTFDQYDGDQLMQLLTTDEKINGKRYKAGGLMFNDRADNESQMEMLRIAKELEGIKDEAERKKKLDEYKAQGLIGVTPRVYLGQSASRKNGLFLFDDQGRPKARFYVTKDNEAKLQVLDNEGKVVSSWPE